MATAQEQIMRSVDQLRADQGQMAARTGWADGARDHETTGDSTVNSFEELRAAACLRLRGQAHIADPDVAGTHGALRASCCSHRLAHSALAGRLKASGHIWVFPLSSSPGGLLATVISLLAYLVR
jgi:hypothetical protein